MPVRGKILIIIHFMPVKPSATNLIAALRLGTIVDERERETRSLGEDEIPLKPLTPKLDSMPVCLLNSICTPPSLPVALACN